LIISGPVSKTEVVHLTNGRFKYTYTPMSPGDYKVKIIYVYKGREYTAEDRFKVQ